MAPPPPDSLERLSHADLIGVVRDLIGEVTRLRAENEKLGAALAQLRIEHQATKDELARLKGLPPRPKFKPSGMDKSTGAKEPPTGGGEKKAVRSLRRRGRQLDRLKVVATIVVKADPPAGSRNKGFEDIVVQELSLFPQVTRYRRERWERRRTARRSSPILIPRSPAAMAPTCIASCWRCTFRGKSRASASSRCSTAWAS